MVGAFYFLILTGQRLESREQIFPVCPVISVFLSPVHGSRAQHSCWGAAQARGHPTAVTQFGLGSWESCGAKAVTWPHVPGFGILPVHVFKATRRERRDTQY